MDNTTIIGVVVVGLGSILSLLLLIMKPIIQLNSTLNRLDNTLDRLSKDFDKHIVLSKEEFDEIWTSEKRQDDSLRDHEGRLIKLETKRTRKKATE